VVECGGLENRLGRKFYVGSNPTPSAFCHLGGRVQPPYSHRIGMKWDEVE
jgi:hypothetical protein